MPTFSPEWTTFCGPAQPGALGKLDIVAGGCNQFAMCVGLGFQGGQLYWLYGAGSPGVGLSAGLADNDVCDRSSAISSVAAVPWGVGGYTSTETPFLHDWDDENGSDSEVGVVVGSPGYGISQLHAEPLLGTSC